MAKGWLPIGLSVGSRSGPFWSTGVSSKPANRLVICRGSAETGSQKPKTVLSFRALWSANSGSPHRGVEVQRMDKCGSEGVSVVNTHVCRGHRTA